MSDPVAAEHFFAEPKRKDGALVRRAYRGAGGHLVRTDFVGVYQTRQAARDALGHVLADVGPKEWPEWREQIAWRPPTAKGDG